MIMDMVERSSESFDPWVVPNPSYTKTVSGIMSLSLPQDLVPKPSIPPPISIDPLSSSLSDEPINIGIQESMQVHSTKILCF
jgi:hypothetical protein